MKRLQILKLVINSKKNLYQHLKVDDVRHSVKTGVPLLFGTPHTVPVHSSPVGAWC